MQETTYADGDFEYWLNLHQITERHPKLYNAMLSMKEAYKNREFDDKPLTTKGKVGGRLKDVPVYPIESVMATAQAILDEPREDNMD